MCIVELGKPCVLKLSHTIENGECLLAIRETCSEVMNISYVSLLLWSWSPDIQSAGLKPNLSPRHLMHFLFPLCAGKNSKLLIHIEAKISEPWANWFRYYSMKLANHCIECSGKVGLFLSFFFFSSEEGILSFVKEQLRLLIKLRHCGTSLAATVPGQWLLSPTLPHGFREVGQDYVGLSPYELNSSDRWPNNERLMFEPTGDVVGLS